MKFLTSMGGLLGLGAIVAIILFVLIGKKLHAKANSLTSTKPEESQQASTISDFKALQRPIEGELKEEGVAKTKLAEPTRHEKVQPSELPPTVSAGYLPMRLRPSEGGANERLSDRHNRPPYPAETTNTPTTTSSESFPKTPEAESEGTIPSGDNRPSNFAPFGRLLKCELLLTIDSMTEETPIVGMVASDLWWNGHLIIPANSEVHGTAKIDRARDRVISGSQWVVVMSADKSRIEGHELTLDAVALDREDEEGSGQSWGLADGSYGLKGEIIATNDGRRIQAFATAAISAASGSLQTRTQGAFGESTSANPRNAALAGTQEVLKQLAADIAAEIQRSGSYLRVPAGKQFYLYVREAILPESARLAPSSKQIRSHEESSLSLNPQRVSRRLR